MKLKISIFAMLLISTLTFSQQQIIIMSYNLLNYPGTDTTVRNPYFRTIINSVNPDILVVCEINSQSGVNSFLNNVMNSSGSTYSAGTLIDGFDTDNAIFYKTSKINFISNTSIRTNVRDINEFRISDKIYHDTLRIYEVHLKANGSDSAERSSEIDSLRKFTNKLPQGTNFIVAGDFNIYSSNEPAYQKLIKDNPGDDGNFLDPLTLTGIWNNFSYRAYHTQSTRVRSFGNGSTGGLDDRFDMILYSNAVKNQQGIKYVPGSFINYGNDGNHYNDSINKIPNTAVSQGIANALHYASDHLPVFASFEFGNPTIVNVKLIPQGLLNVSLNKLSRRDTVVVSLRNSFSPYNIAESSKKVIDSVTFNVAGEFRNVPSGSYYISVETINSIQTWSNSPVQYSTDSIMNYDFTTSISQAFGNNLVSKGGRYCVYNGEVNDDGFINLEDVLQIYNDANLFVSGYQVSDLNGDSLVDLNDVLIAYENAGKFIFTITP